MIRKLKFCDIVSYKKKSFQHPKHCICIDPVRKFFLFINTDPSIKNPDGDVPVKPIRELNFLDHHSYINTSYIERIYEINIEWSDPKGKLSEPLIEELSKIFLTNNMVNPKKKINYWSHLNKNLRIKLSAYKPKALPIPKII